MREGTPRAARSARKSTVSAEGVPPTIAEAENVAVRQGLRRVDEHAVQEGWKALSLDRLEHDALAIKAENALIARDADVVTRREKYHRHANRQRALRHHAP